MLVDVLTAFAVVVAVGLFFGILLALFINLFGIEEDEKTKQIRSASNLQGSGHVYQKCSCPLFYHTVDAKL